ncbi:MAG: hypothetical protein ABMA64_14935 [Myxococcota bacterium]
MWWVWLAGCGEPPAGEHDQLDPVARLVRVSMAVRGTRPTLAEIEAVRDDPDAIRGLVHQWLESDAFGLTIKDMWSEILELRNDTFHQLPALGDMQGYKLGDMYRGTVEEPLELVRYVVMNDRPFTEVVTADYMLTDEITAGIYGVPYEPEAGGWQVSRWPDDRPLAGLLSSAQVWRRWESDGSNFNRMRANMVAGKLLCEPFESRDIVVSGGIDVADPDAVANAVRTDPACVACHQSLDPLAGYFWGYKRLVHRNYVADSINSGCEFDWGQSVPEFGISYLPEDYCYPIRQYNPADEDDWYSWGLREPAYFGQPLGDASDLGRAIAADSRFSACMARQFAGYLAQVEPAEVPFDATTRWQQVLESTGFDAKEMVAAIVLDPAFSRRSPTDDDPLGGLHTVRPEQYARAVEDLTGFRWWSVADRADCASTNVDVARFGTQCWGPVDLSDSDVFGFRAMAGGVDGKVVLAPTRTVTPTKTLVMAQLANNAAGYVVEHDFALPADQRRLLGRVEPDTTDRGAIEAQLAELHARILGEPLDPGAPEIDDDYALFELGGWELAISALLQDPRMMFY